MTPSGPTFDDSYLANELAEAERAWRVHEGERRALMDRRIRAVWRYRDAGHTLRETALVMSDASGVKMTTSGVNKIIGCGYPAEDQVAS